MKKILLVAVCLIGLFGIVRAQVTKKELKTVAKADAQAKKGDYDKAIASLDPVLKNHEDMGELWDKMIGYYFAKYESMKDAGVIYFNVNAKDPTKELLKQLGKSLDVAGVLARKASYDAFVAKCKEAQRLCENSHHAGIYLRNFFYDQKVDTGVSKEARRYFKMGEQEFVNRNYYEAAKHYQSALQEDSMFFKARLYLGDSYYAVKDYARAATYFREACERYPDLLEPRKYLVDAIWESGHLKEASQLSVEAIYVYPDGVMFSKLKDLSQSIGKEFDRHWMKRPCGVNRTDSAAASFEEDKNLYKESCWYYYLEAKEKIKDHCSPEGIIRESNPVTKQRYLEAYCWEYMLKNSDDPSLAFARDMMSKGKLDCYVLYSMYHVDLLNQLKDLKRTQPDKIKSYLNSLML